MSILAIIVLALVQGLTEFLPVSSSAHLILVPELTGWPDQSLSFDVAVHLGTLLAVCMYFHRQIADMIVDWCRASVSGKQTLNSHLAWMVVVASVPVAVVGVTVKDLVESNLRSAEVIAWSTIIFGLVLGYAAWFSKRKGGGRDEYSLLIMTALLIGCAQALALIPGVSRSGITMTAAILLGLNVQASARFSFLLSIPTILMASALLCVDLIHENSVVWNDLFLGATISFVGALLCIHWFLKLLDAIGFMPFVVYRLILGTFLLWWIYNVAHL